MGQAETQLSHGVLISSFTKTGQQEEAATDSGIMLCPSLWPCLPLPSFGVTALCPGAFCMWMAVTSIDLQQLNHTTTWFCCLSSCLPINRVQGFWGMHPFGTEPLAEPRSLYAKMLIKHMIAQKREKSPVGTTIPSWNYGWHSFYQIILLSS